MVLSRRNEEALAARGLDPELAARYGLADSSRSGFDIEFPYLQDGRRVNTKYRTFGFDNKRFCQDKDGKSIFWNYDALLDPTLAIMPPIITEGEFDALAAIQAGFLRTVSVPTGAPAEAIGEDEGSRKYAYLDDVPESFREAPEIIICADDDGPGANLLADLSLRLGRGRCKWVKYPKGCKDLNDALRIYGPRGVVKTINRARWVKVDGVYRMGELPPVAELRSYDTGIVGLSKHYRIRLGDFCVVTGIPSMGKSTFIGEVCGRMVENYGWNVAFASFEQHPQLDHKRNLRTFYNRKLVVHQSGDEISAADRWIDEHFAFVVPSEDDDVTLTWVLDRMAAAVIRYGCKIIVIDPYNEMDHMRPAEMSLTEYTGFAIKQIRKFAAKFKVHVIVAAHPAKMRREKDGKIPIPGLYDISDSAHWANKADVGIVIHRENETTIRVVKSRYHDRIGMPGEITGSFDIESGRYVINEPIPAGASYHNS